MLNRFPRVAFVFLVAAACARSAATPEPIPETGTEPSSVPAAPTPVVVGAARSWTIIPASEPRRYTSTAMATLELTSDSGVTRDTLTQRTRFTLLTASASGSTSFLGSIESLSNEAGARIGRPDAAGVFPVSFTGHIVNGSIVLDALNGQTSSTVNCSNPAYSALNTIQRNVISLPSELSSGMTWKDSTSATGCSGTVPISTTTVRSYRVIGEVNQDGRAGVLIERNERTLASGEGSENQHRILINATGTGAGRILVDRTTGALLDSEGEQRTALVITAGKSQRFNQVVREKTTADR